MGNWIGGIGPDPFRSGYRQARRACARQATSQNRSPCQKSLRTITVRGSLLMEFSIFSGKSVQEEKNGVEIRFDELQFF